MTEYLRTSNLSFGEDHTGPTTMASFERALVMFIGSHLENQKNRFLRLGLKVKS